MLKSSFVVTLHARTQESSLTTDGTFELAVLGSTSIPSDGTDALLLLVATTSARSRLANAWQLVRFDGQRQSLVDPNLLVSFTESHGRFRGGGRRCLEQTVAVGLGRRRFLWKNSRSGRGARRDAWNQVS